MHRRSIKTTALVAALALVALACDAKPNDYTGDKKADLVYQNWADGSWHQVGVTAPIFTGQAGDVPVAGDYDNDGRWEPAVLRGFDWVSSKLATPIHYAPPMPTAAPNYPTWSNSALWMPSFIPVPGDYDGDGDTDPAYYAVSDGTWWISGRPAPTQLGIPPTADGSYGWDVPAPADYDGDGKTDVAVFRPTDSTFRIVPSTTGFPRTVHVGGAPYGLVPVPADYDGDGKADPAVTDLTGYHWWIGPSDTERYIFPAEPFSDALALPADYDGDGRADFAVLDSPSGHWRIADQPTVTVPDPSHNFGTAMPATTLWNLLRLTYFFKCQVSPDMHEDYPTHCPTT